MVICPLLPLWLGVNFLFFMLLQIVKQLDMVYYPKVFHKCTILYYSVFDRFSFILHRRKIFLFLNLRTKCRIEVWLLVFFYLQKAQSHLKLPVVPSIQRLMIYRWAHQALVTPSDHPLLPLIWQKFFVLYLRRPGPEYG